MNISNLTEAEEHVLRYLVRHLSEGGKIYSGGWFIPLVEVTQEMELAGGNATEMLNLFRSMGWVSDGPLVHPYLTLRIEGKAVIAVRQLEVAKAEAENPPIQTPAPVQASPPPPQEPLAVTKQEIEIINGRVKVSTLENNKVLPKPLSKKKGKKVLYLYTDVVKNWPEKWDSLPLEEEARAILKQHCRDDRLSNWEG